MPRQSKARRAQADLKRSLSTPAAASGCTKLLHIPGIGRVVPGCPLCEQADETWRASQGNAAPAAPTGIVTSPRRSKGTARTGVPAI
jgi:hypothetical protein